MLHVTQAAASQLAELRQSQGYPENFGARVFGHPATEGEIALRLTFAEVPAEDDQVTEQAGTKVFVAPEVAEPLAASALDVEETQAGPQLVITPRAADDS